MVAFLLECRCERVCKAPAQSQALWPELSLGPSLLSSAGLILTTRGCSPAVNSSRNLETLSLDVVEMADALVTCDGIACFCSTHTVGESEDCSDLLDRGEAGSQQVLTHQPGPCWASRVSSTLLSA